MRVLKAGVIYFLIVFGAGFVLGTFRITFLVPSFGVRMAELLETPIMLTVSFFSARWLVQRFAVPKELPARLAMGGIALALMLIAEFTLVLWLRNLSLRQYMESQDPIAGTVYYIALVIFAIMPLFVGRWSQS